MILFIKTHDIELFLKGRGVLALLVAVQSFFRDDFSLKDSVMYAQG